MALEFTQNEQVSIRNNAIGSGLGVVTYGLRLKVRSAQPPLMPPKSIFGVWVWGNLDRFTINLVASVGPTVEMDVQLVAAGGTTSASSSANLTIGVEYAVMLTWASGRQWLYVSGIPSRIGSMTGAMATGTRPTLIGPVQQVDTHCVFQLGELCIWENWEATLSDAQAFTNNADPTTLGATATARYRWTLAGPPNTDAKLGDAGLKNAYDPAGGPNADRILKGNPAGTAVYVPDLAWLPAVTARPYVGMCGKIIGSKFVSDVDGSETIPTAISTVPHLILNGVDKGALGTAWQPPPAGSGGGPATMPIYFAPTPGNIFIGPKDTAALSAPVAWCVTPAGATAALDGVTAISNRSGKSSMQSELVAPAMPVSMNIGLRFPSGSAAFHHPWKNRRMTMSSWPPGNRGKMLTAVTNHLAFSPLLVGIEGPYLVAWVDNNGGTDWRLASGNAATTVTELVQYRNTMAGTNRKCRVYDVRHVAGQSRWIIDIAYTTSGPGGKLDYDDLWICMPKDFDISSGIVKLDTSDPYALSNYFLDRMPSNISHMRMVDTICFTGDTPPVGPWIGADVRHTLDDWNWGDLSYTNGDYAYASVGPMDPVATPYVYSPDFLANAPNNLYNATLAADVTTAPAVGTRENWTISDAATAPVFAGLYLLVDAEWVHVVSWSPANPTRVVVSRGSRGTKPAVHAGTPRPIKVSGRLPVSYLGIRADGHRPGQLTCTWTMTKPHNRIGLDGFPFTGGGPVLAFDSGETLNLATYTGYWGFVTGPMTHTLYQTSTNAANGGALTQTYKLNPNQNKATYNVVRAASNPHESFVDICAKFPSCVPHVNVWPDASETLLWELARGVRDHLPVGRGMVLEHGNEPWGGMFTPSFYYPNSSTLYTPPSFNRIPNAGVGYMVNCYVYNADRARNIFKAAFDEVGRGAEVKLMLNMGLGHDPSPYFTVALNNNIKVDYAAVAPYTDLTRSDYNGTTFNSYDNQQALDLFIHDLVYNPNNIYNTTYKTYARAIADYNSAMAAKGIPVACKLYGYEGGMSVYAPVEPHGDQHGVAQGDSRSRDMGYDPLNYFVEWDTYRTWQDAGFVTVNLYGMSAEWHPEGWGVDHSCGQPFGRGDGVTPASDGVAYDNRTRLYQTGLPNSVVSPDSPERRCTVRRKAFVDWLAAVAGNPPPPPPPPATTYTFAGPAAGTTGHVATFAVTPDGKYTGVITVTITPADPGITSPVTLTFADSSATQSFSITPTVAQTLTLAATSSPALTNPAPLSFVVSPAPPPPATSYTLVGPAGGVVGQPATFTVTPNGTYTGSVSIAITPADGGITSPVVLTWTASATPQTFVLTPSEVHSLILTAASSPTLTNPAPVTYAVRLPAATTYAIVGPSTGVTGKPATFMVTPNGTYTGVITVAIVPPDAGIVSPVVLTYADSAATQSFVITPTIAQTLALAGSSSPALVDPPPSSFVVQAAPPPLRVAPRRNFKLRNPARRSGMFR